jgi:hypothetical protein
MMTRDSDRCELVRRCIIDCQLSIAAREEGYLPAIWADGRPHRPRSRNLPQDLTVAADACGTLQTSRDDIAPIRRYALGRGHVWSLVYDMLAAAAIELEDLNMPRTYLYKTNTL